MSSPRRFPVETRLALAMTTDGDVEEVKVEVPPVYESSEILPRPPKRAFEPTSGDRSPDVGEKKYKTRMVICVGCHIFGTRCSTLSNCNECLFRNTSCQRMMCSDFDTGKCRKINCGLVHVDDGYPLMGRLTIADVEHRYGDHVVEKILKKDGPEREIKVDVKNKFEQKIGEEFKQEAPEKEFRVDVKQEVKAELEQEIKTEARQEVKTEFTAEAQQEIEGEVKWKIKSTIKPEVKNEANIGVEAPAGQRIICCTRCRQTGRTCDNGYPCKHCAAASKHCQRSSCPNYANPGIECGCNLAHKDDQIGGKVGKAAKS